MIKAKRIELVRRDGGEGLARVTFEEAGREWAFTGDLWLILYDLDKTLKHWQETVIPRLLEIEKMSDDEINKKLKDIGEEI